MVAASTHTAIKVVVDALRKAGTDDPDSIRQAISQTQLTAATGQISFNRIGEVRKNVQVQIVRNGEWRYHSTIKDKNILAPPES